MKFLSILFAVLLTQVPLHPAAAGGSLALTEVQSMIKAVPELQEFLQQNFKIESTGTANRLGRIYGNLQGERVGPYEFRMQLADEESEQWPWKLVIETDIKVLDAQGEPIERPDPMAKGLKLVERNPRITIVAPSPDVKQSDQSP